MAGRKKKTTEASRESVIKQDSDAIGLIYQSPFPAFLERAGEKILQRLEEPETIIREGDRTDIEELASEINENLIPFALAEETEDRNEKMRCIDLLTVDPINIEVGRGLLSLVDPKEGAKLMKQCSSVRRHIALELGIVMPVVRFRYNLQLKLISYIIKIRELEVAEGEVMPSHLLAMGPKEKLMRLPGEITAHHNDAMPGKWIAKNLRSKAERLGCMITNPVSIIAGHLGDVCRSHATGFLGFQEVHTLLEKCRKSDPEAVDKVYPAFLPLRKIRKILQNLLRESVSIRNLITILEALAKHARNTQNVETLTEYARTALSRAICKEYMNNEGVIYAVVLEPEMENTLSSLLRKEDGETFIDGDTDEARSIMSKLGEKAALSREKGLLPIIICEPSIRPALWKLAARTHPDIVVLSRSEIAPDTKVIDWVNKEEEKVTVDEPCPPTSGDGSAGLDKEEEKETVDALTLDIKLEKWLASFITYNGYKYDMRLDEDTEEILIKAIERGIGKLKSSEDSTAILCSSIIYAVIRSSVWGSTLEGKLKARFPKLHFWNRDEQWWFKTIYHIVGKISLDEEPPENHQD